MKWFLVVCFILMLILILIFIVAVIASKIKSSREVKSEDESLSVETTNDNLLPATSKTQEYFEKLYGSQVDEHYKNISYVKDNYSEALKAGVFSEQMDKIVEICESDLDNAEAVKEYWHATTGTTVNYYMFKRLRIIYDKRGDIVNSDRVKKLAAKYDAPSTSKNYVDQINKEHEEYYSQTRRELDEKLAVIDSLDELALRPLYADYLNVKKYGIEYSEYEASYENLKKQFNRSPSIDDITWNILNQKALHYGSNNNYELLRITRLNAYKFLNSLGENEGAISFLLCVLFIDLSGWKNNLTRISFECLENVIDTELISEIYDNRKYCTDETIEKGIKLTSTPCSYFSDTQYHKIAHLIISTGKLTYDDLIKIKIEI